MRLAVFVCHCAVITDREIDAAVECGARDECAIASMCGAGRWCGGCLPVVRALLRDRGIEVTRSWTAEEIHAVLTAAE